jgi:phosphate/sulfate permease
MATPRRQSDAAARQTVGFLIGSLIGFGIAARLVMNDPDAAGQNAWAGALVIVIACGVAGVVVASVIGAFQRRFAVPPKVEATLGQRFRPSPDGKPSPNPEHKPMEGVQGTERTNGQPPG